MLHESDFSMIVLAGGKSSRMGADKADLCLKDKTFLEIQIEKGRQLGIEDIQVSGYRRNKCSCPITEDRFPGKGPLGGLEACLRKAKHEKCLVLSVDVPLVPVQELEKLMAASQANTAPATILKHGGNEQPLIAVYHRGLADAMLEEITQLKGSVFAFINRTGYAVYESFAADHYFCNVNYTKDYLEIL